MKRTENISLCLLAAAFFATGCAKLVSDGTGGATDSCGGPIMLSAGMTRAAVDSDKNNMQSFLVWGGAGGSANSLFDAVEVSKDGHYEGTRYWVPGSTHDFCALHPAALAAMPGTEVSCGDDGSITVRNFDTSGTGAEAVDLMTASAQVSHNGAGTDPGPVPLTFHHQLARVRFSVTAAHDVTLSDVSLRGIVYSGTFTSDRTSQVETWTDLKITYDSDTPPFTQEDGGEVTGGDTTPTCLLGGDLLLIPQRITRICGFSMTWTHVGGESETVRIPLDFEAGVLRWEAGKSYHYRADIKDEGTVVFDVSIKDWTEEDYTVEW